MKFAFGQIRIRIFARLAALATAIAYLGGLAHADIYTLRMGSGAAALVNQPNAVATFVDKYSDAGVLITSIPLPTTASGANRPLTEAPNSTSVGHLSLSTDGQYLVLGGYDADDGTAGVRQGTTGRVIGRVKISDGSVDTTTTLSDAYPGSTGNSSDMRSVVSTDGLNFWATGQSFPTTGGQAGVQYATLGATTGTRLAATPTNTRVANIFDNQLYISSASGSFVGISKVGTGVPIPTADDQSTTTLFVGTAATGSGTASPYDFWFKDANTLYVADDRTTATGGGIQKWEFDGANWNNTYTLNTSLSSGVRGLDGRIVGGNVVLYASTSPSTTDGTANNAIVTVTDSGASSAFSTLFNAPTNTVVRGVVYVAAAAGLAGDYNSDGKVDAADYVLWRNDPGSFGGTPAGYNTWRANFGAPGPGLGSSAAVPEAGSVALVLLGLSLCGLKRRGR